MYENMMVPLTALYLSYTIFHCQGINLIDLPTENIHDTKLLFRIVEASNTYPRVKTTTSNDVRRYWLVTRKMESHEQNAGHREDEKDANLKNKISTLVMQTLHDTERKIKSVQHMKDKNRDRAPYRAGFILSMVKKTRDVLNELFNVAVKHRDDWKALEQLKIFELIVHTNVDTTNLVRQLVEIHIQNLNASTTDTRRVVLL